MAGEVVYAAGASFFSSFVAGGACAGLGLNKLGVVAALGLKVDVDPVGLKTVAYSPGLATVGLSSAGLLKMPGLAVMGCTGVGAGEVSGGGVLAGS